MNESKTPRRITRFALAAILSISSAPAASIETRLAALADKVICEGYPNAMAAPWKQVSLEVPGDPESDPERGVDSSRHKPWSTSGVGTRRFEWVTPKQSLQLEAFQRLVELLRKRGNDVLVVIGPFKTHIMAPDNLPGFTAELDAVRDWLREQKIPSVLSPTLESALYGDASHPLTEGYRRLAEAIHRDATYQDWLRNEVPEGP